MIMGVFVLLTIISIFFCYQFDKDKNLAVFFKKREYLLLSLTLFVIFVEVYVFYFRTESSLINCISFKLLFISPFFGYLLFKLASLIKGGKD